MAFHQHQPGPDQSLADPAASTAVHLLFLFVRGGCGAASSQPEDPRVRPTSAGLADAARDHDPGLSRTTSSDSGLRSSTRSRPEVGAASLQRRRALAARVLSRRDRAAVRTRVVRSTPSLSRGEARRGATRRWPPRSLYGTLPSLARSSTVSSPRTCAATRARSDGCSARQSCEAGCYPASPTFRRLPVQRGSLTREREHRAR